MLWHAERGGNCAKAPGIHWVLWYAERREWAGCTGYPPDLEVNMQYKKTSMDRQLRMVRGGGGGGASKQFVS